VLKSRSIFPLFNAVVGAIFGTLIGYYVFRLLAGMLIGALIGLLLGAFIEGLVGMLGQRHWLYRRRVLFTFLLECLLAVFVVGPYTYAFVETAPDPHPVCCHTPQDLGAEVYEAFTFKIDDKVTLAGWFVPPAHQPGPVIFLLHGGGGDRLGTAWHAQQFIEAGYGVVMYDQRALGESTGKMNTAGWQDEGDLRLLLEDMRSRPEIDPDRIGLVGLSLGGKIVLTAASMDVVWDHPLWVEGVGAQRIEDFPMAEDGGERFATLINALILKMVELRLGLHAPPPILHILPEISEVPVMIVVGGAVEFETRIADHYRSAAGDNVEFWVIPGAWHVGGPGIVPMEYAQRMLEFFTTAFEVR
jgi:fermentation-respiration switch protein FrsA (DUF1100 family)